LNSDFYGNDVTAVRLSLKEKHSLRGAAISLAKLRTRVSTFPLPRLCIAMAMVRAVKYFRLQPVTVSSLETLLRPTALVKMRPPSRSAAKTPSAFVFKTAASRIKLRTQSPESALLYTVLARLVKSFSSFNSQNDHLFWKPHFSRARADEKSRVWLATRVPRTIFDF
jgi:hypothetical protein